MTQKFNVEFATKYSIAEAVILRYFFIERTKQSSGACYTYANSKKIQEQFPFFSIQQIQKAIRGLKREGFLVENKVSWLSGIQGFSITKAGANELKSTLQSK